MIKTKLDLEYYLAADKYVLGKKSKRPYFKDCIWKYQISMRMFEYYLNKPQKKFFQKILYKYYEYKYVRNGIFLGFDIPPNTCGPGLRLNHVGQITINGSASVGRWCDIHQGVNIGNNPNELGEIRVPKVGDNVYIGPGAKLFGNIHIGDKCIVGANAVVNNSFRSESTIVGIPARIIKPTGTSSLKCSANASNMDLFFLNNPRFKIYI